MKTPNLSIPSVSSLTKIKPSKTVVLVSLAVLFTLIVLSVGAIQSVKRAQAIAASNSQREASIASLQSKIAELEKDNGQLKNTIMLEQAKVSSTCDYIKSFSVRYRLAIPPLCQPPKL